VFGNSFGALLGFEIAYTVGADALIACACRAPQYWDGAGRGISEAEIAGLLESRGLGDVDEETREILAETLRADARLSWTYHLRPWVRLSCPVHVWGGTDDRTVTATHLDAWQRVVDGSVVRRSFAADHHVLLRCHDEVADAVRAVVSRTCREAGMPAGGAR
jgi:surfactin synthase thioesterase subunit